MNLAADFRLKSKQSGRPELWRFRENPSENQIIQTPQKARHNGTMQQNQNTHLKVGPAGVDCIDAADDCGAENAEKDDRGCGSRESW